MKIFNLLKKNNTSHFEINSKYLFRIIRLFYGILTVMYFYDVEKIIKRIGLEKQTFETVYLWPVKWLEFFPEQFLFALIIAIGSFLFPLICIIFPHKRFFRTMAFLFFFQHMAFKYSSNEINHSTHAFLFTSFWLIFMTLDKETNFIKKRNKFYLQVTQVSFLGTYFLSGLWKLRYFIISLIENGWQNTVCLESNFAIAYNINNKITPFYLEILNIINIGWGNFLWLAVILFQISTPLAAWFPSLLRFYGLMIILFHMSTGLLMHVHFIPTQFLALIILINHPYLRKHQTQKSLR